MIGIVTESDIVKKVIGSDRDSYLIPVEDIMSSPIVGIEERRPKNRSRRHDELVPDEAPGHDYGRGARGRLVDQRLSQTRLHRRILAANSPPQLSPLLVTSALDAAVTLPPVCWNPCCEELGGQISGALRPAACIPRP